MRRAGAGILLAVAGALALPAPSVYAAPSTALASPRISVKQALDDLQRRYGYSFIFDSRVLDGKNIFSINDSEEPVDALRRRLADVGLILHRVSAQHFAITYAPASFTPAVAILSPQPAPRFSDVILVTAAAPHDAASITGHTLFELNQRYLNYYSGKSASESVLELPQVAATFTPVNTSLYGPGAGLSFSDMRGLGFNRNLILVNGRRAAPTNAGNGLLFGADLNRFAKPFLQRIEVEPMAAGARYGDGAAIGAVNFVMREGLNSFEAGADYGVSEKGDNEETVFYAIGGSDLFGGAANITGGLAFTSADGLIGEDREESAVRYALSFDEDGDYAFLPDVDNSPLTGDGLISGAVLNSGRFAPFPNWRSYALNEGGGVSLFTGAVDQRYNAIAELTTVPSVDRVLGYSVFSAELSPKARVFAEAYGGWVKTSVQLAPLPVYYSSGQNNVTGNAAVIPLDNPTVPASLSAFIRDQIGDDAQSIVLNHRYTEIGPRRDDVKRQHLEMLAGVELGDDDDGKIALSYRYGRTKTNWSQFDRVNVERLNTALDADRCGATEGCSLADFFDPNGLSADVLSYVVIPELTAQNTFQEHAFSLKAGKAFSGLMRDDVNLRLGADLRRQRIKNAGRGAVHFTTLGLPEEQHISGVLTIYDVYAGGDFPLARASGLVGEIDLSGDVRITGSSEYSPATNIEIAGSWRPGKGVEFFTRQQFGHRMPNIAELYSVTNSNARWFEDPCGQYAAQTSDIITANCASGSPLGVSADYMQGEMLTHYVSYGNPDLEPEEVRALAAGISIEPTAMMGGLPGTLEISAIWRSFHINNQITDEYDFLYACYGSVDFSSPACRVNSLTGNPSITRNPVTQEVTEVEYFPINVADETVWRGLDIEMRYAVEPSFVDRLWFAGAHTYTHQAYLTDGTGQKKDWLGLPAHPRHESLISMGAARGVFSVGAQIRRRGRVETERKPYAESKIAPAIYADLSLRYAFMETAYLQLGVENLTDHKPPLAAYTEGFSTLPSYYDLIGRRFTISTRLQF